jgi:cation-transporting ATPase 13A1
VPARNSAIKTQLAIRRRFQFSSALKRMSTVSSLPGGRLLIAVKGAPETIKTMLSVVPKGYDDTYKWFTRKGSRVLALAMKEMDALSSDKVSIYPRVFCLMSRSYAVYSRSTSFTVNKSRAS